MAESNEINNTIYDAVSNALENKINNCITLLPSTTGKSAYDLAVDYGFVGSERDWLSGIANNTTLVSNLYADAQTLSEFVYKPAGFKVARRLAPPIDTLQFYIDSFDSYIATIPNIVNDAINNTAVEGGILADTFVTVNGSINQRQVNMGFSDIAAIKAIVGANIGMRVYSTSHASNFIFKASLTSPVNDGTVLQGVGGIWEMEDKDVYFASWFATPNVQANQALKLQAGYAYATSKGKPFIVDDVFWVDARAQDCSLPNGDMCGILILDNSEIIFNRRGHLKVLSNNYSNYHVMIACNDVDNYVIDRPVLTGDRLTHDYTGVGDGEWGYGLTIYESSNGTIINPRLSQMTGDGLYVGKAWGSMLTTVPTDIIVTNPIIDSIRRNGYSLTGGNNVQVLRPFISKVGTYDGVTGKAPMAAIDIEPENASGAPEPYIRNCIIDSPVLHNCDFGLMVYATPDNLELSLHIKGVLTLDNIGTTALKFLHVGAAGVGELLIDEIYHKTSSFANIYLGWNASSKLRLTINKINHPHSAWYLIRQTLELDFIGKRLGNVTINDIYTIGDTALYIPSKAGYVIDGYKIYVGKHAPKGVGTFKETSTDLVKLSGKDTYIDSRFSEVHSGFSVVSTELANAIWMDSSVATDAGSAAYINTTSDYRRLKIGLHYKTERIGDGCNINGISANFGAGVKTTANCKTLGGWIELQNVEGQSTRIIDSYGTWTFG